MFSDNRVSPDRPQALRIEENPLKGEDFKGYQPGVVRAAALEKDEGKRGTPGLFQVLEEWLEVKLGADPPATVDSDVFSFVLQKVDRDYRSKNGAVLK